MNERSLSGAQRGDGQERHTEDQAEPDISKELHHGSTLQGLEKELKAAADPPASRDAQ